MTHASISEFCRPELPSGDATRCLPTLDVTQAPGGEGELRFQTPDRSILLRRFSSLDEAWRESRGVCGEFSRLVKLIPTDRLEALLSARDRTCGDGFAAANSNHNQDERAV